MPEILEVKEKHEDELLELENCVSVGVGKKEVGEWRRTRTPSSWGSRRKCRKKSWTMTR